ncbi:MAG: hypothetical protein AB9835_11705 [Eubacteriales bacterium]
MEKSKLGISIALFSALLYLMGASGVFVMALAVGYVLLFEESDILKRIAVKALILTLFLMLLTSAINLLSMMLSPVLNATYNYYLQNSIYNSASAYSPIALNYIIQYIPNIINGIAQFIEIIIFIVFGLRAYKQRDIKIKWIDNILNKHFN